MVFKIGPGYLFMDSDFHHIHLDYMNGAGTHAASRIKENFWVGARVVILKGVAIGKGAVVASATVVTKHVQEGASAQGNPVRVVGAVYA